MFIVAITRWGAGFDQQLAELARMLDMFPYDLRARVAGPLPVIVARIPERERAKALMDTLREWGHGVVGCDARTVPGAADMHQPREFSFEGEALHTEDHAHQRATSHLSEAYALVHAMVLADHQSTKEQTRKSFSAARAVLTGGMVMTRKSTTTTHSTTSESEERIYLFRRSGSRLGDPILFCQHQLRYTGLGAAMGHSSHESFAALTTQLRAWAPRAYYDDQLRQTRRKTTFEAATTASSKGTAVSSVTSSNASGVDLAAYLIVMAHSRGQL
ncbi:hypothetical protein DB30_06017 [Enhygromyxa salina]|uniref:Uncharacterized protein n=1 Tax=Enhygromyxa salina TaxID=215803 RepID=A0A0C1ZBL1_9BACT|nr:hypothetical protein [Enhygromyxa salina]KIG15109.1 hypothetical protein DB30_06017 [Enhygromyxa salina]